MFFLEVRVWVGVGGGVKAKCFYRIPNIMSRYNLYLEKNILINAIWHLSITKNTKI